MFFNHNVTIYSCSINFIDPKIIGHVIDKNSQHLFISTAENDLQH